MKSASPETPALKFLVIRRDNIGDLVCTTPLIRALRERFPQARICVLVNSYNAAVLNNNPDIDKIYVYTKAKHRTHSQSLARLYFDRFRHLVKLRREHFDWVLLAGESQAVKLWKLAKWLRPGYIAGFATGPSSHVVPPNGIVVSPTTGGHEVERTYSLLAPLSITPPPLSLRIAPNPTDMATVQQSLGTQPRPLIGIHLSARKQSQRWPAERFAALITRLHNSLGASFLLLWAPGDPSNPLHPGDDPKARAVMEQTAGLPVTAYPTYELAALIGALGQCDAIICSDGGAMHLAAALAKPILCFFGDSDPVRWYPWGVPHVLMQPQSKEVKDITVERAAAAFENLFRTHCSTPAPIAADPLSPARR